MLKTGFKPGKNSVVMLHKTVPQVVQELHACIGCNECLLACPAVTDSITIDVLNRETLEPAPAQASYIANRMRERGILLSTDGPFHNVLKIKPPLVFTRENADFLVATLDEILAENFCAGASY